MAWCCGMAAESADVASPARANVAEPAATVVPEPARAVEPDLPPADADPALAGAHEPGMSAERAASGRPVGYAGRDETAQPSPLAVQVPFSLVFRWAAAATLGILVVLLTLYGLYTV